MLRLSRASVISDLEFLIRNTDKIGRHAWTALGAERQLGRHSYGSAVYSFDVDILSVRVGRQPHGHWEVFIVTEYWRDGQGQTLHSTKWLKLVAGKSSDVLKWISMHRQEATDRGLRSK